jgi:hypothetical protein
VTTRFYLGRGRAPLPTDDSACVLPSSWSAGWNRTAGAVGAQAATTYKTDATSVATTNAASGTSGHFTAFARHVISRPLAAQTISGNIKGQLQIAETNSTDNYTLGIAIKVIKPDGTDRGVLLATSASDDTSATPPEAVVTTKTNRKYQDSAENTSIALLSLAVSAGDYLVIEEGIRQASTSVANGLFSLNAVDSTDLPEDTTTTTSTRASWVEFDSDIAFLDSTTTIHYYASSATPEDSAGSTGTADPTAVTPPANMAAGDLVCMIGQQRATGATLAVSESGGQTWTSEAAIGGTNITARLFWCAFNGTWSANPSVDFSATTCNSVQMHVFRPGDAAATWAVNQSLVELDIAAAATQTITGQTTTGTAPTVTLAGWFTADDNAWGSLSGTNWGVCGTAQYRNTSGTDQSSTYAYKVQTAAGATGDVSKTQTANGNDAATTFIITFSATSAVAFIAKRPLVVGQSVNRASLY